MAEGNPILIRNSTPTDPEVDTEKKKLQAKVENIAKVNFISKYLACGVPFEKKKLHYINIKTKGETFQNAMYCHASSRLTNHVLKLFYSNDKDQSYYSIFLFNLFAKSFAGNFCFSNLAGF